MTFMRPPANKTAVIDFPTTYIVTISPVYVLHSLCQLYIFILLRNIIEILKKTVILKSVQKNSSSNKIMKAIKALLNEDLFQESPL